MLTNLFPSWGDSDETRRVQVQHAQRQKLLQRQRQKNEEALDDAPQYIFDLFLAMASHKNTMRSFDAHGNETAWVNEYGMYPDYNYGINRDTFLGLPYVARLRKADCLWTDVIETANQQWDILRTEFARDNRNFINGHLVDLDSLLFLREIFLRDEKVRIALSPYVQDGTCTLLSYTQDQIKDMIASSRVLRKYKNMFDFLMGVHPVRQ